MTDPRFLPADLSPPFRNAPQAADGRGQKIRIERIKLASDWAAGGTSFGYPAHWGMEASGATDGVVAHQVPEAALFLRDPCSLLSGTLAADSYVTVWQPEDATDGHWEPLVSGGASYGGATGTGTMGAWSYAKISMSALLPHSSDISLDSGGLKFASAGTYMVAGAISNGCPTAEFSAKLKLDAVDVAGSEFMAHMHGAGDPAEMRGEVSCPPVPLVITAGQILYLYAQINHLVAQFADRATISAWKVG